MEMSWGLMTPLERQEQANRRRVLSKASLDADIASHELGPWRQQATPKDHLHDMDSKIEQLKERFQVRSSPPNPSFSSMMLVSDHQEKLRELEDEHARDLDELRVRMQSDMSDRLAQFEAAMETANRDQFAYYEKRLSEAGNSEKRARDLGIEVEKMRINEEILLKSYEALKKQYDAAVKELTTSNSRLQEEVLTVRHQSQLDFAQETDRVRADIEVLRSELEAKRTETQKQAETINLLKLQLATAEAATKRLEESEARTRGDANRYREAEYQIRSLEIALGEEKKRKEQFERDYAAVTNALGKIRGEVRQDAEAEFRPEIEHLQAENRRIRSEYESKLQSLRSDVHSQALDHISSAQTNEKQLRDSVQSQLDALRKESLMWKDKTVTLVSKYYSVLKSLKREHERLKADTEVALQRLKADNDAYTKAALSQLGSLRKEKTKRSKTKAN
jgi:hypothetical protein